MQRIVISLDHYEEIFDDFDISKWEVREISKDFVEEVIRRVQAIGIPKKLEIILTLPKEKRKHKLEKIIVNRVKQYFKKLAEYYKALDKRTKEKGLLYLVIGIGLLSVISWAEISLSLKNIRYLINFLYVPSWFFTWNGLYKVLEEREFYKDKGKLYEIISKAHLKFDNEEKYEN